MRILLVEDEVDLANMLRKALKEAKYSVDVAFDGEEALDMLSKNKFDLVILDIMLPKLSGLWVCAQLRREGNSVPIIMLTARGGVDDRVDGLNCGADDYLPKPFALRELLARIKVLLRRAKVRKSPRVLVNGVTLDTLQREFKRGSEKLDLSFREFGILEYLFYNQARVVSRKEILENVWGDQEENVFTNTVDVHIRYLRRKVGDDFIKTVRGFGYTLQGR